MQPHKRHNEGHCNNYDPLFELGTFLFLLLQFFIVCNYLFTSNRITIRFLEGEDRVSRKENMG